jgi:hypothetical protein
MTCELCNGTGFYGDNGPGQKGNREYVQCDCTKTKQMTTPAPELKPAGEWASEWLGYNVGPEQKRLAEWIDEIKANAAAHARHKAMNEAAELMPTKVVGAITAAQCLKWRDKIIALRDAKET